MHTLRGALYIKANLEYNCPRFLSRTRKSSRSATISRRISSAILTHCPCEIRMKFYIYTFQANLRIGEFHTQTVELLVIWDAVALMWRPVMISFWVQVILLYYFCILRMDYKNCHTHYSIHNDWLADWLVDRFIHSSVVLIRWAMYDNPPPPTPIPTQPPPHTHPHPHPTATPHHTPTQRPPHTHPNATPDPYPLTPTPTPTTHHPPHPLPTHFNPTPSWQMITEKDSGSVYIMNQTSHTKKKYILL